MKRFFIIGLTVIAIVMVSLFLLSRSGRYGSDNLGAIIEQNRIQAEQRKVIEVSLNTDTDVEFKADFYTAVLSNVPWDRDNLLKRDISNAVKETKRSLRDSFVPMHLPWVMELLSYKDGNPRPLSLNRWAKPITISVQLPNDLEPVDAEWSGVPYQDRKTNCIVCPNYLQDDIGLEKVIQNQVEKILPSVREATKLPVDFITSAQENADNFARIRIIYQDTLGASYSNVFKGDSNSRNYGTSSWPDAKYDFYRVFSPEFGVRFSPEQRSSVEGYFVTNEKNEIEMSFCFIWRHHSERMIRALTSECVIRSLGIPGTVDSKKSALLRAWNEAHATYAKRSAYDGDEYFSTVYKAPSGKTIHAGRTIDPDTNVLELASFLNGVSSNSDFSTEPSIYDWRMVQLLYSDELKPSMGHMQVGAKLDKIFETKK